MALATLAAAQCSIETLSSSQTTCTTPPCEWIESNSAAICSTLLTGAEIVNGPSCHLQGTDYGCLFVPNVTAETPWRFCCPPSATPTSSVTPTQSGIRVYNSATDFSATNGANRWFYGFNDSVSHNFGSTDFALNSWYLSSSCSAYITKSVITTSGSCSTPVCPTIKSWIEWRNPAIESWDMKMTLMVSNPAFCGDGVILTLFLNGEFFSTTHNIVDIPLITSITYTLLNVSTVKLLVEPMNGCDCDETTYNIKLWRVYIPTATATASSSASGSASGSASATMTSEATLTAMGSHSLTASSTYSAYPSSTASPSASSSASTSSRPSKSSTHTPLATLSPQPTVTTTVSSTPSSSATATATATATGNWFAPPPMNLTNISNAKAAQFITTLSSYDPSVIKEKLNQLGAKLLENGSFAVNTTTFSMSVQALPPTAPHTLKQGRIQIDLPPLSSTFPSAASVSLIEWTSNPYANSSSVVPDSPIITLNILDASGNPISIKNLTSPIYMSWTLHISPDDPRLQSPPIYLARCDVSELYLYKGDSYIHLPYANLTAPGTWRVPCLLNTSDVFTCSSMSSHTVQEFACLRPEFSHSCSYWDSVNNNWTDEGCIALNGTFTTTVCMCSHLTDFSTRVLAVVTTNEEIYKNAGNVYSNPGQYALWFALFGGIAVLTVILGAVVMQIDIASTRRYVHSLLRNPLVKKCLQHNAYAPVYIYDKKSSLVKFRKEGVPETSDRSLNLFHRIIQHHPSLQFLFRFDPRLSRVFRLLFVFVIQFHSLFVTASLHSFTTKGVSTPVYEMLALATITMALNIPVFQLLFYLFNYVGTLEFEAQFPLLYEEYRRRAEFEKYGLVYLFNKGDMAIDPHFISKFKDILAMPTKDLLVKMLSVVKRPRERFPRAEESSKYFPCHTWTSTAILSVSMGWFAFCLNYLILFAATTSAGPTIMTSWATSQVFAVFITQPFVILMTLGFYWALKRWKLLVPSTKVHSVPSLYYFSDPWNEVSYSNLTAEFAYTIFIKCGAYASHAEELAYAPLAAVIPTLDEKDEDDKNSLEDLYTEMMGGPKVSTPKK